MSGSASGRREGTPSTTTPIAGPWLSPQVVKRKRVPKEEPAIGAVATAAADGGGRVGAGPYSGTSHSASRGPVASRRLASQGSASTAASGRVQGGLTRRRPEPVMP